jgi:hypothetical protein
LISASYDICPDVFLWDMFVPLFSLFVFCFPKHNFLQQILSISAAGLADRCMDAAWVPCDFQLTHWSMQPAGGFQLGHWTAMDMELAVWAPGLPLPVEYASDEIYDSCLQTYVATSSTVEHGQLVQFSSTTPNDPMEKASQEFQVNFTTWK